MGKRFSLDQFILVSPNVVSFKGDNKEALVCVPTLSMAPNICTHAHTLASEEDFKNPLIVCYRAG